MKILILTLNYAPEPVGIAVYSTGTAQFLAAAGHDVSVIAAKPYYPAWTIAPGFRRPGFLRSTETGVSVLRCPLYVPRTPSGLRRILHHASFALAALVPMFWHALARRPDVVLVVCPSLLSAPVGRLAAWLAGVRCWLHVQDFEVEAAFVTGLMTRRGVLGRLALAFENWILRAFDRVSTISPQMRRRLTSKGVPADRVLEFRNWANTAAVQLLARPSAYRSAWGITRRYVALYSGTLANKQGVDVVLDAARLLASRRDLQFIICGDGPSRTALEQRAAGLDNVLFRELQPVEKLGELLGLADVHLLPQRAGAADLVLPSKLGNVLASGRPVVATADPGTGLFEEMQGCGVVTSPGDASAFANAVVALLDDPQRRVTLGRAARQRALERWTSRTILAAFEDELRELAPSPNGGVPARST